MQHIEETISGSGGIRLYTQRYELENPKGAVVILHGYCEHSARYNHVVEAFTQAGFNCYLLDHRGHGKSDGPRAAVLSFEEYLDDMDIYLDIVRKQFTSGPMFLLGHSMGGLIATNYVLSRKPDFDGVILSSPYLGLKVDLPMWKDKLSQIIAKFLPAVSLKSDLDPHLLTHDDAIVQEYISDPAVPKIANARWFVESTAAQNYCLAHATEWKWNALFMHGGDDRIADPQATRNFHVKADKDETELVMLEGLYHEIFNEVDRKRIIDMTVEWLNSQIAEG